MAAFVSRLPADIVPFGMAGFVALIPADFVSLRAANFVSRFSASFTVCIDVCNCLIGDGAIESENGRGINDGAD